MSIYLYIFCMAFTTYLIRMLPLTLFQKPIKSRMFRSFLYYIPYSCLTAMTIPSIFTSTASVISAALGFIVAVALALKGKTLVTVAIFACITVYVVELFI